MDFWDWVIFAFMLFMLIRSHIHFSSVQKSLEKEGRDFGPPSLWYLFVLMFPWAIREAEKDYIREQKDNRQGAQ
jgi:hypothetical protein